MNMKEVANAIADVEDRPEADSDAKKEAVEHLRKAEMVLAEDGVDPCAFFEEYMSTEMGYKNEPQFEAPKEEGGSKESKKKMVIAMLLKKRGIEDEEE